jgi:hypothetical protein
MLRTAVHFHGDMRSASNPRRDGAYMIGVIM